MAVDKFRRTDVVLDKANGYILDEQFGKVGDIKGRDLVVQITNNGVIQDQSGLKLVLAWTHNQIKNTGIEPFIPLNAAQGIFKVTYPAEMMNEGTATANIGIVQSEGTTFTRNFTLRIEKNAGNADAAITSDSWTVLVDALEKVKEADELLELTGKEIENKYLPNLEEIRKDIDSRGVNVLNNGLVADGSTVNDAALKTLIDKLPAGSALFFPAGRYQFSSNIALSKKLTINGIRPTYQDSDKSLINGTVISGGGLFFTQGTNGSRVNGIGVETPATTNGFDIRGTISDIVISDCVAIARDHCYLIESYDGTVSNITVINCESHDSIHGFISKAKNVTFESCSANNHKSWGFGSIADNINTATKIGAAIANKVINCRATECGVGYNLYKRDYFGDGSAFKCTGNQFINDTATMCNVSLAIGDTVGDTGSGKYKSYPVDNTVVSGFVERAPVLPSSVNQSINLSISGSTFEKDVNLKATFNNRGLTISAVAGAKKGEFEDLILLQSSTTPSVMFGHTFRSNNTEVTRVTDLIGGIDGDEYEIILWDDNTSLEHSNKIKLLNGPLSGYGNSIRLKCQSGVYFELSRNVKNHASVNADYANATGIRLGNNNFVDLVGTGNMPNKISVVNPEVGSSFVTFYIRTGTGKMTFGGFDPNQFVVPSDMQTEVDFGTGLMTQWVFLEAIQKYVLVNKNLSKYA